ncbi:MAG: HAD family hydrolase [Cyanobacteria bacterium]|nr:HAD family hydrolase [Cyanobacteriota bacterium]MDW8202261.1 HAD family hydrolase [Cyanobacteriota bacterium SKYGB_h_bin112]
MKHKGLFLDRDGVLINYVPYLSHADQVVTLPGAGQALRQWQQAGYLLIVITNQSGIGRGYFTTEDVAAVHQRMQAYYQRDNVTFHDILICPHTPSDRCSCRKPSPQLVLQAAEQYHIDLSQSFFVGDAPSDIECAQNAGCQPVLVLTGRGKDTQQALINQNIQVPTFRDLADMTVLLG